MASVLQVATIKDQGGNANAIEIANSSANVTINHLTAAIEGGSLNLSTNEIVGLANSAFNGVGMILGSSYGSDVAEFEPGDASWYARVTITHSLTQSSHYVLGIGALAWYANSSSRGQVSIQAFKPDNSNFDTSQKVAQLSSGTHSLWSGSNSGQVAGLAPFFGMWKPGNTSANKYSLMMAEEGGSDFRAGVNAAARSWLIILECTGVA